MLICLALLTRVDFSKSLILLATVGIAALNWLVVRGRAAATLLSDGEAQRLGGKMP